MAQCQYRTPTLGEPGLYCESLAVRRTKKSDEAVIAAVLADAFGRAAEAELALDLLHGPAPTHSLIGERNGDALGYLLMSEIEAPFRALALMPHGVVPQARELQIGTRLVRNAIADARRGGYDAIFIWGDPRYYERFGFSAALAAGFSGPWRGANFMVLPLQGTALPVSKGKLALPSQLMV